MDLGLLILNYIHIPSSVIVDSTFNFSEPNILSYLLVSVRIQPKACLYLYIDNNSSFIFKYNRLCFSLTDISFLHATSFVIGTIRIASAINNSTRVVLLPIFSTVTRLATDIEILKIFMNVTSPVDAHFVANHNISCQSTINEVIW